MGNKQLSVDKKYDFYEKSVQNPEFEVDFLLETFPKIMGKQPTVLREDFCGTGAILCEWVKRNPEHIAHGVDLDPEPILIGKDRHWGRLSDEQKERAIYHEKNVLDVEELPADCIVAFNFSYLIFKQRKDLLTYFKSVRSSLNNGGIFYLDLLGGPDCQTLCEEETEHKKFSYFWDCDKFNPITHEAQFYIHFEHKGVKHEKVFSYDWRLWTIPELRDLLTEAGFDEVKVYWEEDAEDEDDEGGNGNFYPTNDAETCDSWVSYIVAVAKN